MVNPLRNFFDKLAGNGTASAPVEEEFNEEEYITLQLDDHEMKQLEQSKQTGDILVKFHKLKSDLEFNQVVDYLRHNSIVILDISLLKASDFTGLKMLSNKLKLKCSEMGWGLGALSNDLLMVTPPAVKFEKKKE
jgi:SepF-like predicted cell division protein (DUF552 family)